jgi:pimeloyl-ACP methyl ester carboxylesterase
MFADVNGIRLCYESQGDGRAVVLVHGLGLSSDMWRYQVRALAQRHRVITLGTRGHDQSSKPPGWLMPVCWKFRSKLDHRN